MTLVDRIALEVAKKLRFEECSHGLPYTVTSAQPIDPWGKNANCRPLCDTCVMDAIRSVFSSDVVDVVKGDGR